MKKMHCPINVHFSFFFFLSKNAPTQTPDTLSEAVRLGGTQNDVLKACCATSVHFLLTLKQKVHKHLIDTNGYTGFTGCLLSLQYVGGFTGDFFYRHGTDTHAVLFLNEQ